VRRKKERPPLAPPFPAPNRRVTSSVPVPQVTPATVAKKPKLRLHNSKGFQNNYQKNFKKIVTTFEKFGL